MRFAGDVRATKGIDGGGRKPAKAALDQAVALVDALSVDWDPGAYEDRHRKRLRAIVRKKEKGQTIKAPDQQEQPSPTADLMAALRKTLDELGGGGGGACRRGAGDGDEELERLSRDQLYRRAQEADVPGRSSMSKEELAGALAKGG